MTKAHRRTIRALRVALFHCGLISAGRVRTKATLLTARRYKVSRATVGRILAKTKGVPRERWVRALWPRYPGRSARAALSDEAWRVLIASYLGNPGRFARGEFRQCVEQARAVGRLRGLAVPSMRTLQRRMNDFLGQLQRTPKVH